MNPADGFFAAFRMTKTFIRNRRVKQYYVYIMSNHAHTIYVGITSSLEQRVYQHKVKQFPGFTARYGLNSLVYFETTSDVISAIEREKQLKGWLRKKKTALIESVNPAWKDLSEEWKLSCLPECHSEGAQATEESVLQRKKVRILHFVQDDERELSSGQSEGAQATEESVI